jgi:hypothetical protein
VKKDAKPKRPKKPKSRRAWTTLSPQQSSRSEKLQAKLGLTESSVLSLALNRLADQEGV